MSETSPITEQANPETELARDRCSPEDLPHDALQTIPRTEPVVQVSEQINAELENLSVGSGRTQVEEEAEWIEQYEPGVYIILMRRRNGTRVLKEVRFSRRRFGEHQAQTWWSDNREKVYERYNVRASDKSSVSGQAARRSEGGIEDEASKMRSSMTIPRTEPVVQVSEQINAQLENLSVGAGRTQVEEEEEEEEEEDVVNDSGRLVQPDAGGSSSGCLKRIPPRIDYFTLEQSLLALTEDDQIEKEELIFAFIDEGIIEKMGSREAAFEKGHDILDRLEDAEILQSIDGGRAVKLHDLIRDMVVRIHKENPSVMEQRRKGIEMAGSNSDRLRNHLEQLEDAAFEQMKNDGGNSTHKTMRQRRKRTAMAPLKSVLTGAVSASEQEQNNVDVAQQQEPLLTGELEQANDLTRGGIEFQHDASDDQDELKKLKGSKSRDMVDDFKSGWTLLMTNLILEIASAVFDQLGYALVGMVLALVALLLSTAELIHIERMARRESRSLLPISHRPSPGKPGGTIVEYFGWVGAVWQCVYSTMAYTYARQKRDNPIKMSLLPFFFLLCVVISKLIKN